MNGSRRPSSLSRIRRLVATASLIAMFGSEIPAHGASSIDDSFEKPNPSPGRFSGLPAPSANERLGISGE